MAIAVPTTPGLIGRALRLLPDEQLVRLAASGREDAAAAIFERHQGALTRYCQSILLHEEDARDAVAETMIKALRALRSAPPTGTLKPWLFRIAHNEAISLVRRRRPAEDLDAIAERAAGEDRAALRERLRELVGDLRALPERQRGALLMRELCGLEYSEIADALGGNEAAIRRSVADARASLHHIGEGRALDCGAVRGTLATGDGRSRRARTIRAHLRNCGSCHDFERTIARRRADLRILVAPAAGSAWGLGLLGGGAALSSGLLGSTPLKAAVAAAVLALAGAGAAGELEQRQPEPRAQLRQPAPAHPRPATATAHRHPVALRTATPARRETAKPAARRSTRRQPVTKHEPARRPVTRHAPARTSAPAAVTPAPAATATPAAAATPQPIPAANVTTTAAAYADAVRQQVRTQLQTAITQAQTEVREQITAAVDQAKTQLSQAMTAAEQTANARPTSSWQQWLAAATQKSPN